MVPVGVKPVCPVFGECGGCQYQHLPYEEELLLKERSVRSLFAEGGLSVPEDVFQPIVRSPREYGYRNRLDLKLLQTRSVGTHIGFSPESGYRVLPITACPIAMPAISADIPRVKAEALLKMTEKHRNANLVVRTGDDGRVLWGGIGRRSLKLSEADYLWTEINGRRIHYSLDTFFQANLAILPSLMDRLRGLDVWGPRPVLFDLYGGVGLFSLCLWDLAEKTVLIEENVHALQLAKYNKTFHSWTEWEIVEGRVEERWDEVFGRYRGRPSVAVIDPPRAGLSPEALRFMSAAQEVGHVLYLSCSPETLVRDLKGMSDAGWRVLEVTPFDFFPRTRHIETLVLLRSPLQKG